MNDNNRGLKVTRTCHCGVQYQARVADLERGWGKSCSKKCAARKRTRRERSGNFKVAVASKRYAGRFDVRYEERALERKLYGSSYGDDFEDGGWDAHKLVTGSAFREDTH